MAASSGHGKTPAAAAHRHRDAETDPGDAVYPADHELGVLRHPSDPHDEQHREDQRLDRGVDAHGAEIRHGRSLEAHALTPANTTAATANTAVGILDSPRTAAFFVRLRTRNRHDSAHHSSRRVVASGTPRPVAESARGEPRGRARRRAHAGCGCAAVLDARRSELLARRGGHGPPHPPAQPVRHARQDPRQRGHAAALLRPGLALDARLRDLRGGAALPVGADRDRHRAGRLPRDANAHPAAGAAHWRPRRSRP